MRQAAYGWRFAIYVARPLVLIVGSLSVVPVTGNSIARQGQQAFDTYPVFPQPDLMQTSQPRKVVERGAYLVKIADCLACHTNESENGRPFAGGLAMTTPFGKIYSPNITPDPDHGIGQWSDADFVRALRDGIRPDGSYYYPVFPYNYFNKMSRDDVLAIKAYLDTVPAVKQANRTAEMKWPFNWRWLQWGWRLLYFDFAQGEYQPNSERSERWNRGAFIVEGPGHCALCHAELNLLGVAKQEYYLAGAFVQDYFAPDITARGLKQLNNQQVAEIFASGIKPTGGALAGPMADVEHNSLRYLEYDDMLAIGEFLRSVNTEPPPVERLGGKPLSDKAGKKLYDSLCHACHDIPQTQAPQVANMEAWEILLDQGKDRLYEVAIRGEGTMPPKGGCAQCSEARVKAAVDYMIERAKSKTAAGSGATVNRSATDRHN